MNDKPKSLSNAEVDAKINAEAHELADKIGAVFDEVQPNLLVALLAVLGVAGATASTWRFTASMTGAAASSARRVLPIPGSPPISTTRPSPRPAALTCAASSASSGARPKVYLCAEANPRAGCWHYEAWRCPVSAGPTPTSCARR